MSDTDVWASGLPGDILHTILDKLALRNWYRFAKVCKSWKSVTEEAYNRKPDRWCSSWLVVQHHTTTFCSVKEDERKICSNKLTSLAQIRWGRLHGSHQDWMIVCHSEHEGGKYFISLINPFTDAIITLPSLTKCIYIHDYTLLISTSPTDPDCIYMCLPLNQNGKQMYLCTQQSESWFDTSLQLRSNIVDAISIVSEQSFYGLTRDNDIWCLKFFDALWAIRQQESGVGEKDMHIRFHNQRVKMPETTTPDPTSDLNFSIEFFSYRECVDSSCGDILRVVQYLVYDLRTWLQSTTNFKIYRLDTTVIHDLKWVELGGFEEDEILFVSPDRKSKILLKAKDLGTAEGNNIYFFDGINKTPRTYSLKDNKFGSFSYSPFIQHMSNPIWLSAPLRWYLYN